MKHLPLFYYPGTWVYVDDDTTLLNCMGLAFSEHCQYHLFSTPNTCLEFLEQYISPVTQEHFLWCQRDHEHYGMLKHTAIDFDLTKITNLANNPARFDEITAMVIDYHMPEMDGFTLSKSCEKIQASKILLTGAAEEADVISGFNQNYIQHYIQKGTANLEEKLIAQLQKSTYYYFQKITAPLLSHLEVENVLPLSDPLFVNFFLDYCARKNIREYYLIDKQGSFLCVDNSGKHFYFVMHTDRSLDALDTMCFSNNELPLNLLHDLRSRQKIPFFGVGKEAWNLDVSEWKDCFYATQIFSGREKYFWTEVNE
jgi:CheY-like chemotaxis protein